MKARYGEAFGPGVNAPCILLFESPPATRARIEQHADHHEIDSRPGALGGGRACQRCVQSRRAIDAACAEMTPAAVVRNGEIGIVRANDIYNVPGRVIEVVQVEGKMPQLIPPCRLKDFRRALANRVRRAQRRDSLGDVALGDSVNRPVLGLWLV